MPKKSVSYVVAALFLVVGFVGCLSHSAFDDASHRAFDDATIVLDHVVEQEGGEGWFEFSAGAYQGGTAVLSGKGMAFWVKDGKGYVVNDKAREAAPKLPQAPDFVTFDDAFETAANSEG